MIFSYLPLGTVQTTLLTKTTTTEMAAIVRIKNVLYFATKIKKELRFSSQRYSLVHFRTNNYFITHSSVQPFVSYGGLGSQQRMYSHGVNKETNFIQEYKVRMVKFTN